MPFISYAQNLEDVMLWRALQHVSCGFWIDVGAQDPDFHSVTKAFHQRGWNGVNVEPDPEFFGRLVARRPSDINLPLALSDSPGTAKFHRVPDTGLSTLSDELSDKYLNLNYAVETILLTTETLSRVCEEHVAGDIHFLKVDVEGFERQVLLGADFSRWRPWIVLVEAIDPIQQLAAHQNWHELLLNANYEFVWFDGLNRFYVANERSSLKGSFGAPPNVFDGYMQHRPHLPPHLWAERIETSLYPEACLSFQEQAALASRCRDTDPIPKVPHAGGFIRNEQGHRFQIMHNGLKLMVDAYPGGWPEGVVSACRGHLRPQEEAVFFDLLANIPEAASMVEIGSVGAYHSLSFLLESPGRAALVIEGNADRLSIARSNARQNNLVPKFVSVFESRFALQPFDRPTLRRAAGRQYVLPQVLDEQGFERVDLLRCDLEGQECEFLDSARALLASGRIAWMLVSTYAHQVGGEPLAHQRCLDTLRQSGWQIRSDYDVHESFDGRGMILACHPSAAADITLMRPSLCRYRESVFRNPLYDLAERMSGLSPAVAEALLGAVYERVMLRQIDAEALSRFSQHLLANGDFGEVLSALFQSEEFALKADPWLESYGVKRSS